MSSYSYYGAYPTKSHPKRTNDVLTWPVWKSYDLQQSHWVKFLPVWDGFFGDDIESEFLFDFSCFFTSNLTQVFIKKFVDLGLIWSAKKCSKLNCYFMLIFHIILIILKRCQNCVFIAYIYDIFKTYLKTYFKQFNNVDLFMIWARDWHAREIENEISRQLISIR